jgi:hypothetical protein
MVVELPLAKLCQQKGAAVNVMLSLLGLRKVKK